MRITIEGRRDESGNDNEQELVLQGIHRPNKDAPGLLVMLETGDGLHGFYILPDRWRNFVEAGNLILGEGA